MEEEIIDIEVVVAELPINLEYKEQGYEAITTNERSRVPIYSVWLVSSIPTTSIFWREA